MGKSGEKWEKVVKIRNFYLFGIFTKWPLAAILDDRKSLSMAFLTISDQYFFFSTQLFIFFQNGRQQPFWIPIFAKIDRDLPI